MSRESSHNRPAIPTESRVSTRSETETKSVESESHETTGGGRSERRSRQTESCEKRTKTTETYEAGPLPPGGPTDGRGEGGDNGGGDFGPQPGWPDRVPEQMLLCLSGAAAEGRDDASALDGDYLLALVERSPQRCRWELVVPERCGCDRAELIAAPAADGFALTAALTGPAAAGPRWQATVRDLKETVSLARPAGEPQRSAGIRSPASVLLIPIPAGEDPFAAAGFDAFAVAAEELDASSSSSSSCGCEVTKVTGDSLVCVGCEASFSAEGDDLDCGEVTWSAPGGDPATGTGTTLTTTFSEIGEKTVTASCEGGGASTTVTAVAVDKIIVKGSDPEDQGPVTIKFGTSVELRALRKPSPADGPWPEGKPTWSATSEVLGYQNNGIILPSSGSADVIFSPGPVNPFAALPPVTFTVSAECCTSSDSITVIAEAACDAITGVEISADPDKHYQRVPPHESGVIHIVGPKSQTAGDELKLTLQVADGTDTSKITVSGATQGDSPLELLVPITESVRQRVIVSYDDSPCREIHVWPVWADIKNFRGSNANGEPLSGNNNPENGLPSGMLGTPPAVPARAVMGGSTTGILFNAMELRADISPKGVSALQGVQFDFKRTIHAKTWARNANDQEWTLIEGPPFTLGPTGDDEDNRDEDLHDRNDVIWVHDTPGLSFSIDEPANADFVTRVMNFTETVNLILMQDDNSVTAMSGPLISDEFDWHSILNGKLVTIDGIGQFERNLDRTNIIAPGHVALGNQP